MQLPLVDGINVFLLIQRIPVKYGPGGNLTNITVFWDNGSTCSLIEHATADELQCLGEPVTVSIDTVNGVVTRETKLYCVEMMNQSGDRILIRAFGVEKISEVVSGQDLSVIKDRFSDEVQSQWGKISKRPFGRVQLLIGEEYAGFHPVQYEA